jgi:transcriptional regulator with GAF, ATPase, and Fis domain
LFVWRDDQRLHFAGGRAFTFADGQPRRSFALGEGLIGQVGREQQPILLKQVPPGYLDVVSGLGENPPQQIALWPLRYNEQLAGVIEIGLVQPLTAQQELFLQRAAEMVASALQTAQTRARIDELLQESQVQTEELHTREEELRAINEELEAQAEAMRADRAAYRER